MTAKSSRNKERLTRTMARTPAGSHFLNLKGGTLRLKRFRFSLWYACLGGGGQNKNSWEASFSENDRNAGSLPKTHHSSEPSVITENYYKAGADQGFKSPPTPVGLLISSCSCQNLPELPLWLFAICLPNIETIPRYICPISWRLMCV